MNKVLFFNAASSAGVSELTLNRLDGSSVSFADVSEGGAVPDIPEAWERIDMRSFWNSEKFRIALLNFLDSWPERPIHNGQTFEQLFKRPSGDSIWWTSVGARRTPGSVFVKSLKKLFILDQLLTHNQFTHVFIEAEDANLLASCSSRCQLAGVAVNYVEPKSGPSLGRRWVIARTVKEVIDFGKAAFAAMVVRILTIGVSRHTNPTAAPVILFQPNLSRLLRVDDQMVQLPFWSSFLADLRSLRPEIQPKFLLRPKYGKLGRWSLVAWVRSSGRQLLGSLNGALGPAERNVALVSWLRAMPRLVTALTRYQRLERSAGFRDSFVFADANISGMVLPMLRQGVASIADWEREVATISSCLSKIDNLRVALVLGEFYPAAMTFIAAVKRLGVPIVGVQHGTIYPGHFVYTVPRGHLHGAPTPDFFAAYGEYDAQVVSQIGSFPRDRVWVTGAPRMDHLVKTPPDKEAARRTLDLPKEKKIILVTTHTRRMYPWFIQVVRAVLHLTRNRSDECIVCIKCHPGDVNSLDQYKLDAKQFGNHAARVYKDHFEELLAACDVLISGSSTTLMEATLLRRKTICANFSGEENPYPYVDNGASIGATNVAELSLAIDLALEDGDSHHEKREDFLAKHLGPTAHGRGGESLAQRVTQLIG